MRLVGGKTARCVPSKHGAIIGVVGRSGAGKTTLIERLLPELAIRGLRVSTIKHAHCGIELDRPGKDSHRHQAAGAYETLLVGDQGTALFRGESHHAGLTHLLDRLAMVDLVLIEGYKRYPIRKIEVWDPSVGEAPLACRDGTIGAVASDVPDLGVAVPIFERNDIAAIAGFIQLLMATI